MHKEYSNIEDWKQYVSILKEMAKEKGFIIEEIALKSGLLASTIKRVFDLKFEPPFEVFIKIAEAIETEVLYSKIDGKIDIHHIIPKTKPLT